MTFDLRRIKLLFLSLALIVICFAIWRADRASISECEMARYSYILIDGESFELFLQNRFRTNGFITSGGWFADPIHSYSIYYPDKERTKYKAYDHKISRSGKPYSSRSISIHLSQWQSGREITCDSTA